MRVKRKNKSIKNTTDISMLVESITKEDIFEYDENKIIESLIHETALSIDKAKDIAKEVTNQLQKLADEWTNSYLQNFIGKKVEVWFERSTIKNTQVGHSQYFFKVYVDETNDLHGLRKDVKITKILADNKVYGEII